MRAVQTRCALRPPLQLVIRRSGSPAELRAAAALRAAAFYTYPEGRSAFAAASHQRMKLDAEWESLQRKLAGSDASWAHLRVTCLLALLPLPGETELAAALCRGVDASCRLPAEEARGPLFVAGTLDVNVGAALPCEELVGRLTSRAYLSNVAVAPGARRSGIASALLAAAAKVAADAGQENLYVHVVADNAAARALYARHGFTTECEESVAAAQCLQRPRRLLLHRAL
jgi:ribosomal protein S18 acetylase RimI-like enzyme